MNFVVRKSGRNLQKKYAYGVVNEPIGGQYYRGEMKKYIS